MTQANKVLILAAYHLSLLLGASGGTLYVVNKSPDMLPRVRAVAVANACGAYDSGTGAFAFYRQDIAAEAQKQALAQVVPLSALGAVQDRSVPAPPPPKPAFRGVGG